jgi:DNA ligase-1
MFNDFDVLQDFVDEMQSTPSSNNKKDILEKWKNDDVITRILLYVNNPYWTFGVTSKQVLKFGKKSIGGKVHADIFYLLDDLRDRKLTGHKALLAINTMISDNEEHEKLILNIIDRDIETRANASLINKVIPGWIPEFKVALANPYEEKIVDFERQEWYASRKLDGVRCICRVENGTISFFSRTGKTFETLGILGNAILGAGIDNIVFDGEVCLVDDKGKEDFQAILKAIRKKDSTIENPKYFIFDALTLDEFDNKVSTVPLFERQQRIPFLQGCEILPQLAMFVESDFSAMQTKAKKLGWEGVMLRRNVGYKGKRSNDLLKVKKFKDAEYKVIRTINDQMRFFEDGKDVERETMAAVIIYHKGYEVKVGSGFSKSEREVYYNDPDKIVGKEITVQYFEETTNQKDSSISLRFPTFKCLHGMERVV